MPICLKNNAIIHINEILQAANNKIIKPLPQPQEVCIFVTIQAMIIQEIIFTRGLSVDCYSHVHLTMGGNMGS